LVSNDFTADLDYDALARLTEYRDAVANVAIEKYTYDATGNRLSVANAGDTVPYAYEATSHRLTSIGGSQRTYDALGNTITAVSGVKELVYNQGGRLSQMKLGGAVAQKYAYNARGERVQRGLDATSAVYTAYDEAGHWLGDYDALGNATQQVIWMDDMPVGLLVDGVLHYIEADHLGTPRLVYDPARNLPVWTWSLKGEVFGSDLPDQDPDGDGQAFVFDMRFPGQRYDAVSGLHYNYFRDYEPSSGRYVQSDPIGLEGGISTYGYVGGSPLGAIDPLGLKGKSAPSAHSWRGYQGTKPQPILPPYPKQHSGVLDVLLGFKTPNPHASIIESVLTALSPDYTQLCTQQTCFQRSSPLMCGPNDAQVQGFVGGYPRVQDVISRGCYCNSIVYPDQLPKVMEDGATWHDVAELLRMQRMMRTGR